MLCLFVWLFGAGVGAIGATVNCWWPLRTGRPTIGTQAREARQLAQDREARDDYRFWW